MAINTNYSLDFRRDNTEEQRAYFVIGAKNGAPLQGLDDQLRARNLEVLNINAAYRNSLALPNDYQGIAVFIQDHVAGDIDHAHGMHAGANIFQTYKTIQQIRPLKMDDHAIPELFKVHGERLGLGEAADEVMPQYKQLDQLLTQLQARPNFLERIWAAVLSVFKIIVAFLSQCLCCFSGNDPVRCAPIVRRPPPLII